MSEVGKGKPPKEHQFKPGQSGNPAGKSSEQKRRELANAARATELQEKMLEILARELEGEVSAGVITNASLRLLSDAQERGFGKPAQAVDHTSSDGSMSPTRVEIVPVSADHDDSED